MGPSDAIGSVFRNYANFSARARRSEYWWFILVATVASVVIGVLAYAGGHLTALVLLLAWCLTMVLPSLAVGVRRLHDTGHSGAWWFVSLVPLVGSIVLLVFFATDSQPGANRWGTSVKYPSGPGHGRHV